MNDEQTKERRQYTPEQKVKIVKEALTTDIGVSGVCRKYGIPNALYYHWQERFFEGALEGFKRAKHGPSSAEQRKIDTLERDNGRMKSVIAEITAENIDLKKCMVHPNESMTFQSEGQSREKTAVMYPASCRRFLCLRASMGTASSRT